MNSVISVRGVCSLIVRQMSKVKRMQCVADTVRNLGWQAVRVVFKESQKKYKDARRLGSEDDDGTLASRDVTTSEGEARKDAKGWEAGHKSSLSPH